MDSHKSAKQDIDISWDDYMDIKVDEHSILVEPKQESYEPGNYYTDINLEQHQIQLETKQELDAPGDDYSDLDIKLEQLPMQEQYKQELNATEDGNIAIKLKYPTQVELKLLTSVKPYQGRFQ